ncbi:MAG: pantoate--beta-alanine ligase [Armatimonadetes bacterium]|nr:pantoate--beta-alanine ligase [Armatimonadota bacterium]
MGALHEGHLSLMRTARSECDVLASSIFVNPLQFGPSEDFSRYPRREEQDFELARSAGVDLMLCPEPDELTRSQQTTVHVYGVSELFEGAFRPGHFDGVATIVAKLFNIVRPNAAFFGAKDLQQCAVLRTMVQDLNFGIKLRFLPTVRESDGLALSSRNAYLSPQERELAPRLFATLCGVAESAKSNVGSLAEELLVQAKNRLDSYGFDVDYLDVVDWNTMRPTRVVDESTWLVAAARLGTTRLIDSKWVLEP